LNDHDPRRQHWRRIKKRRSGIHTGLRHLDLEVLVRLAVLVGDVRLEIALVLRVECNPQVKLLLAT
jgi:hypothetical protein